MAKDEGHEKESDTLVLIKDRAEQPETKQTKCSAVFQGCVDLFPVCLGAIFYVGILWARNTLTFPFFRTTIRCATPTPEGLDRNDPAWSGSPYCNDRMYVADEAQILRATFDAVSYALQILMLPVLGVAGDSIGRKPVVMLSILGLFVCCACLLVASIYPLEPFAFPLVITGSTLTGLTSGFFAAAHSMLADKAVGDVQTGVYFGVFQIMQGFAVAVGVVGMNEGVVRENPYVYVKPMVALVVVCVVGLLVLGFFLKETLPKERRSVFSTKDANPFKGLSILSKTPICWIAATFGPAVVAVSILTMLQSYAVALYGWSQANSVYLLLLLGSCGVLGISTSFLLIKKIGPTNLITIGLLTCNAALILLHFASYSQWIFLAGCSLFGIGCGSSPAYFIIISKQVPPEQQSQLQGAMTAIFALALAGGTITFSYLQKIGNSIHHEYLPFLAAIVFMGGGTLVWILAGKKSVDVHTSGLFETQEKNSKSSKEKEPGDKDGERDPLLK